MSFLENLKKRRSIYTLGKNIDGEKAIEVIKEAVRQSPTAFNSQSARLLFITESAQEKLWGEIAARDLKAEMDRQGVPESAFEKTGKRLNSFKAAYGTVLFFEDQEVIKSLQEKFPLYAENFPAWSEQGSGIVTVNAWTALAEEGIGANLQHYNPVIDHSVAKEWTIPDHWKLRSQLVFGSIEAEAGEKEFMDDDKRFRIAK